MAIHHAITKRAVKLGVELEQTPEGYSAIDRKLDVILNGENPKYLLDDIQAVQTMALTFKSFKYTVNDDSTVDVKVRGTTISVTGLRASAAFPKARELWQESREDLDEDDEEADQEAEEEVDAEVEEEEGPSGSVVSERYRAKYAEMGHPTHCGDWLALTLNNLTTNDAGVNVELLELIAATNGVNLDKYKRVGTGWQGRLRMTARNILARVIWLDEGKLKMPATIDDGKVYQAPADWMASQKFKAKPTKKAAKSAE